MSEEKYSKMRVIRPEEEDRRTDNPPASDGKAKKPAARKPSHAQESGVESMPDGEAAAGDEAAKARDD